MSLFFALYFLVKAYSNGDTTSASAIAIATAIAVTAFASELTQRYTSEDGKETHR